MAAVDPYADPEGDAPVAPPFALPPRAGTNTLLGGLRPADFVAMLGGLLSSVRMGSPQQVRSGGGLRPGLALFPLAQGLEASDQRARQAATVEGLASKYGGQNPEYDAALEAMVQDPSLGSKMLFQAITASNQQRREDRLAARRGQAGIDATSLMGNIPAPQITSTRPIDAGTEATGGIPLGTGDALRLPPAVEEFVTQARPRTTDEMVKGLQALPPGRQGMAADALKGALEKQREKDSDRVRDTGEAKAAMKALGGSKGLYSASPEELESAALMLTPGTKFGAQLSMIANHRRAGDAKADALATRKADAEWRRDYLTSQADQKTQNIQFQQDYKTSEAERRTAEAADRKQAAADRLQLGRDSLNAKVDEWGRRAGERSGKLNASEQKTVQGLAVMEHWLGQAEGVLKEMKDAGMLPGGEGIVATGQGWKNRFMKPNAEALRKWKALQPGVVGFDRSILNDIGARAIKAHEGALQLFDSPPTYEGGLDVFKQMREQLNIAKQNVPALIKKGQVREGIGAEESAPGMPTPPPTAPSSSPGGRPSPGAGAPMPSMYVGGAPGRIIQPDMPKEPPPAGMVWVKNPVGRWGAWDASKPIPQGFMR